MPRLRLSADSCCGSLALVVWVFAVTAGSDDVLAQRVPPRLSTTESGSPVGRRAAATPHVPVGSPQCPQGAGCRIAEVNVTGTNPRLYVPSADLLALAAGQILHWVICVCDGTRAVCLEPGKAWVDRPSAPPTQTPIKIESNSQAVSYLMMRPQVPFRIRWSTSLEAGVWNGRNSIDSEGILTYVGDSRPAVTSMCRD